MGHRLQESRRIAHEYLDFFPTSVLSRGLVEIPDLDCADRSLGAKVEYDRCWHDSRLTP
jgi:hypothetical protein